VISKDLTRRINMQFRTALLTVVVLSCTTGIAQQYDTPETRRLKAEALLQAGTQKKESVENRQTEPSIQQKEAQAKEYVGKTFWYLPNPSARKRLRFYEGIPSSSHSLEPSLLFTPLTTTSFVVTGVVMPPPLIYAVGKDEYLLEIKFPDSKIGYVNVVGCCGLMENLYNGKLDADKEYVSSEPAENILARERVASEKAAIEENLAREKSEREKRLSAEKAALTEREWVQREQARRARPSPRIGMTKEQVINQTNWGKPSDINRTTTSAGTREQWVYGVGRYLYFDGNKLTAIQD
jgi:hypothetical protein